MSETHLQYFLAKLRNKEYIQAVDYMTNLGLPIVLPLFGLAAVNSCLDTGDPAPIIVYHYATEVIERIGKPCLSLLTSQLNSTAYADRQTAIALLGRLGYIETLPLIMLALNDENRLVRVEAQYAIDRIRKGNSNS